jgi:hypothetical protein
MLRHRYILKSKGTTAPNYLFFPTILASLDWEMVSTFQILNPDKFDTCELVNVEADGTYTAVTLDKTLTPPTTEHSIDMGISSEGARCNGPVSAINPQVFAFLQRDLAQLTFYNAMRKVVLASWSGDDVTEAQLGLRANCDLFYIPQDYIRYTNITGRTNFTKIGNRGTLGNTYDLAANNVPSGWFAV